MNGNFYRSWDISVDVMERNATSLNARDESSWAYIAVHLCARAGVSSLKHQEVDGNATVRPRKVVVFVSDLEKAERFIHNCRFFLDAIFPDNESLKQQSPAGHDPARQNSIELCIFEPWDVLPFETISPSREILARRLKSLCMLLGNERGIVVVVGDAVSRKVIRPGLLANALMRLRVGEAVRKSDVLDYLTGHRYFQRSLVEQPGDFAPRGSVVDVFCPLYDNPLRLEFFGGELESIRVFDGGTQRSVSSREDCVLAPATESFQLTQCSYEPATMGCATARLQGRCAELAISLREIEPLKIAIERRLDWPGLDQSLAFFSADLASFGEYLAPDDIVLTCDKSEIDHCLSKFSWLVAECAESAERDGRLFPAREEVFCSDHDTRSIYTERANFEVADFSQLNEPRGDNGHSGEVLREREVAPAGMGYLLPEETEDAFGFVNSMEVKELISKGQGSPEGKLQLLLKHFKSLMADSYAIVFAIDHISKLRKLNELFSPYGMTLEEAHSKVTSAGKSTDKRVRGKASSAEKMRVVVGDLSSSLRVKNHKRLFVAEHDLFPQAVAKRRAIRGYVIKRFLGRLAQLKPGDHVVHTEHGIGCYQGLEEMTVDGQVGDFLRIDYAENAKLYIPVEQLGKVEKYLGSEGSQPQLSRLGSKVWAKTKEKVKQRIIELAGQIVSLYARRQVAEGFCFDAYDERDSEFAETFPFVETPAQEAAIKDVLSDMNMPKPMDRLICGDVGFGKTEVALRAVFKAVSAGKQVAVLVPTTVLACQHCDTFSERLSSFAINVCSLNRFQGKQGNANVIQGLAEGTIDVVIGTHRLLQPDVHFKDLGLIVVDEEHRFGVAHKEKLKRLRCHVDVLSMSATPIPRTLQMSLCGIRDLSVIETPPCDRQAVKTFVGKYDDGVVRDAIQRELERQGQVFYIHNEVQTIVAVTEELRRLLPEARIYFAHGQMKSHELENIMHRFVKREFDVLVSTTIVESGLDIPNANTIIIRKADKLGLAELYQLRGRVGRSSRKAYAYLFVHDLSGISDVARQRISVIQELDDIGMGFRVALQDMEIRGAGNLLGRDQSGQVNAVGFEMYSKILEETVEELARKERLPVGLEHKPHIDPEIKISCPAYIPSSYIPDMVERLVIFQRLVDLENQDDLADLRAEIEDRFGSIPEEVHKSLALMRLRVALKQGFIISAGVRGNKLRLIFHSRVTFDWVVLKRLLKGSSSLKLAGSQVLVVSLSDEQAQSLGQLARLVEELILQLKPAYN